jgi:ferredoxin
MTVLSYNGKKKDFKPGTPLSKAVAALGVKPTYSCKKGDCATCEIFLAGRLTKPCVAKVPPEPKLKSLQEKGLEIRM